MNAKINAILETITELAEQIKGLEPKPESRPCHMLDDGSGRELDECDYVDGKGCRWDNTPILGGCRNCIFQNPDNDAYDDSMRLKFLLKHGHKIDWTKP